MWVGSHSKPPIKLSSFIDGSGENYDWIIFIKAALFAVQCYDLGGCVGGITFIQLTNGIPPCVILIIGTLIYACIF